MQRYEPKLGMRALFESCTEQDILEFEQQIEATLPEDYREFLLQWNGCRFWGNLPAFTMLDTTFEGEYGTVNTLFGLSPKPDGADLRTSGVGYEFAERVPDRFLAIGENRYQEQMAISLRGDDRGSVIPLESRRSVGI